MGKKKPRAIQPSLHTLIEQIAGRLTLAHNANPNNARQIAQRIFRMIAITGDADVRKTYNISLKIDFDDAKRHDAMLHLTRRAARQLLTQATLLADNRQPQVAIECDDFFEGGSKEGLMDLTDVPEEDAGDGIVGETPDEG